MNLAIVIVSVILPLLPLVLAPARAMGCGGMWTLVGAGMLVGLMMIVFFGVKDMGEDGSAGDAVPQLSDKDVQALEKIFR